MNSSPITVTYVWQDREIRFDVQPSLLEVRPGEILVDYLPNIEDIKGNAGEPGTLYITNLRITWISSKYPRTNLTIGYSCIVSITVRTTTSRLWGTTQALYVQTKFNNTRFEFIFTNLASNNPKLFQTVQHVLRSYEKTKLYRDLKLRGAIVKEKQLILLPEETVYRKVNGVWNLSSDQGNLGSFFITNVRLVWFANLAENFNVSIPYLQMKSIRLRDSKFGLALVVETMPQSGGYVLGFRIDPSDVLHEVAKELTNIHTVFSKNPLFGVSVFLTSEEQGSVPASQLKMKRQIEEGEVLEDTEEDTDAFAVYYADVNKNSDREPVYSKELGLAIEKLREGITIESLWNVQ